MSEVQPIFRKSSLLAQQPTRRAGIKERRLLSPEDSSYQNIVIINTDDGAEVELHQITTSESIFVLKGTFEVTLPDSSQTLEAGDFCYFPPKTSHGIQCVEGPGQFFVVFAPSKRSIEEGWLRTMYTEAWNQYCHEDNISQSRNNLYLGVQAALIAILTGISGSLIGMDPLTVGSHKIWVGLGSLGTFVVVCAIFATRLAAYWKGVTKAGRGYLNLRWIAIRAIEEHAGMHQVNLTGMEHNWRVLKIQPWQRVLSFC